MMFAAVGESIVVLKRLVPLSSNQNALRGAIRFRLDRCIAMFVSEAFSLHSDLIVPAVHVPLTMREGQLGVDTELH